MAMTVPTKLDLKKGLILEMRSIPARQFDPAFDSYLLRHENGCDNHTLTLVLKLHLHQVSTFGLPLFPHLDANGEVFWIRPWETAAWQRFQSLFKQQCAKWNNRFWLIPPGDFSQLDVQVGSRKLRPSIYCHLYVDFVGSTATAHRTIEVVNLDRQTTAAKLGVQPTRLDSGAFRSHEGLYDALDVKSRSNRSTDNTGTTRTHANYLTIVHEIGHAIGLDHIGVVHKDPLCQAAILVGDNPLLSGTSMGALFAGKSNSRACYGTFAVPARGDNVMGRGTSFDATNAQPWVDRIALHTNTNASKWTVSLKKVAPRSV